jgi:hypothetical protein
MNQIERPDFVTDEHLAFLDNLRVSGVTNMFGATPYIMQRFNVRNSTARKILSHWMVTFNDRHPEGNTDTR